VVKSPTPAKQFFFMEFRDSQMIKSITFKKIIAINEKINIKSKNKSVCS
jgi:hypothetical protein